ncbi:MAG TPA: hypothetical protein V6D47_07930 [Oscillatoriaceae cyanobacterium]
MRPVLPLLAAITLLAAGCGTAAPGQAVRAPLVQHATLAVQGDSGTFTVRFAGLNRGYHTLATVQDIQSVRLTLTSPQLATPLVQIVGPQQLSQPIVNVSFSNVPAGNVQVQVQALDTNGAVIGANQSTSTVSAGQTSVLQMTVTMNADSGAASGTGNLATVVTFQNPSPMPTATPQPTPTPSPTPAPVTVVSDKLVRHLFSDPDAQITLANTSDATRTTTVYAYFFSGNTLKDSQAYQVTLMPQQQSSFTIHAKSYFVDKLLVQCR